MKLELECNDPTGPAEAPETAPGLYDAMRYDLTCTTNRSAWERGVAVYAAELLDSLQSDYTDEPRNEKELYRRMLNGANDWVQYSFGGCALIHDPDIAARLSTPSELRRNRNGERRPNAREEWLDVQARALRQAAARVRNAYRRAMRGRTD